MAEERKGFDWTLLASLLSGYPFRVEGQWYYKQTILLDGYHFVRCRFDSCLLKTQKGAFALEGCVLWQTSVQFEGEAHRVVRLYNWIAPEARREAQARWPFLAPILNSDGTYSIP